MLHFSWGYTPPELEPDTINDYQNPKYAPKLLHDITISIYF